MKYGVIGSLIGAGVLLAGCAGSGGWKGASMEKAYDRDLEAQRMVAIINNDDYYEFHRDGRIYVLSDAKDFAEFLGTGEIPLRVTRIGAGPGGETVVFGIAGPEKDKKEGFGSIELYDGRREGYAKGFYAEVFKDKRWKVFGDWNSFAAYRKGLPFVAAKTLNGVDGAEIQFAQADESLVARFRTLHR